MINYSVIHRAYRSMANMELYLPSVLPSNNTRANAHAAAFRDFSDIVGSTPPSQRFTYRRTLCPGDLSLFFSLAKAHTYVQ